MRNALAPRPTISAVLGLAAAAAASPDAPLAGGTGDRSPTDGPMQLPIASLRAEAQRFGELRPRGAVQADVPPRGASHGLLHSERRP
ncbi:hypothetical protein WME90_26560 [Sorangium sp. So ce375]|uniref:hypothetical protein n=1 Tax=Sorangium sp. So ce375 TaxID=3133306 RepID=UPI003F5B100B